MKYLQLFEAFHKDEYYTVLFDKREKLTGEDYDELQRLYYSTYSDIIEMEQIGKRIEGRLMPDHVLKYIQSTFIPFSSRGSHIWIWKDEDIFDKMKFGKRDYKYIKRKIWEIFQMPDEWFLVMEITTKMQSNGFDKTICAPIEYYKCDQLDGLLEMLKDKKVIR